DRWQWRPDLDKGYTVRSAYHILTYGPGCYPPKQTWSLEALYLRRLIFVFRDVERSNRLSICSSLAALSGIFGLLLALGLTLHW
ncbi:hypothetical protein L195_g059158, partial [Trifolium pratense]